jgi:uncharacterized protein (TIGR02996 family)
MSAADEQPFLDAILARYADDGPRLVYADFLDDHGDPERADLVRVQLVLARLPDEHPRRPELAGRQADLLQQNLDRWTAHLDGLAAGVEFRRGVPDSVSVEGTTFLEHGDELFRRAPVRRVRLLDAGKVMTHLVQCPHLARVEELDLCDSDLGNGGVNVLVRSPHLAGLHALDLGFNGIDDAGVRLLARSAALPGLRDLALNDNREITGDGVRALADSPFFGGLRDLDLSENDVNDAGVRAVAESRSLGRLERLKLAGNHIGDAGVATLARSGLLRRLLARDTRLDLRANAVGPVGGQALARADSLASALVVDLTRNYLGDDGVAAVVGSPHVARVRIIRLAQNQLTDSGAVAVAAALPALPYLRRLDVSANRLTRRGVETLFAARADRPVEIDISGNVHEPPIPVGEVVGDVLGGVADLKRRIANPSRRP